MPLGLKRSLSLLVCGKVRRAAVLARAVSTVPATTSPLEARRELRASLPLEEFRVTGVSFEGRQDVLATVQLGQVLMLRKEPDNPYDKDAVDVSTLSGQSVGYVPRDLTRRFPFPVTFAMVNSVGPAEGSGLLGLSVFHEGALQALVRPTLPPLALTPIPSSLAKYAELQKVLDKSEYARFQDKAAASHQCRCLYCGGMSGREAWPVTPQALWEADHERAVLRLVGAYSMCSELLQPTEEEDPHAAEPDICSVSPTVSLATMADLNEWHLSEAQEYLDWLATTSSKRFGERQWTADLSWLND